LTLPFDILLTGKRHSTIRQLHFLRSLPPQIQRFVLEFPYELAIPYELTKNCQNLRRNVAQNGETEAIFGMHNSKCQIYQEAIHKQGIEKQFNITFL